MLGSWTRDLPKAPGYYLRVNAGHGVSLHHVSKQGRWLCIFWGDGPMMRSSQRVWKGKLTGWLWYGPIPEPPYHRYPLQTDANKTVRSLP